MCVFFVVAMSMCCNIIWYLSSLQAAMQSDLLVWPWLVSVITQGEVCVYLCLVCFDGRRMTFWVCAYSQILALQTVKLCVFHHVCFYNLGVSSIHMKSLMAKFLKELFLKTIIVYCIFLQNRQYIVQFHLFLLICINLKL